MPDYSETRDLFSRYLRARVPVIVVRSIEPGRVMSLIAESASDLRSMAYLVYSRTEGLKELLTGQSVSDDTSLSMALENAQQTYRSRLNVNFIFTDVDDLEDESPTSRHFAELARMAEQRQGTLIFLTTKPVWTGLARLGMSVQLDLPTADELAETINEFVDNNRGGTNLIEWQYDEIRQAAEILNGVTETEAINVIASMLARREPLMNVDLPELSTFKDQIFGDLSGIERIKMRDDYKIGGLTNLRKWLDERERHMKQDLSQTQLHPPKGILLVGVPGCGKSLSAKAIASDWRLPLYRLDMSAILGMYVGQSESRLREALDTADRVAPCVLWIDEIEKGLAGGGGSGDSGVARRLVGQFLFWLQESTSKVFLVATANDVTSLPPELLRKGRFDEMFFVDLPDAQDREDILRLYFQRYFSYDIPPHVALDLVSATDGFSGSDIDAVVHELALSHTDGGTTVLPADWEIRQAFEGVIPYSATNPEDIANIRAWAQGRCRPAGALEGSAATFPAQGPGPIRRVLTE